MSRRGVQSGLRRRSVANGVAQDVSLKDRFGGRAEEVVTHKASLCGIRSLVRRAVIRTLAREAEEMAEKMAVR